MVTKPLLPQRTMNVLSCWSDETVGMQNYRLKNSDFRFDIEVSGFLNLQQRFAISDLKSLMPARSSGMEAECVVLRLK